jgi:hypothetical protein
VSERVSIGHDVEVQLETDELGAKWLNQWHTCTEGRTAYAHLPLDVPHGWKLCSEEPLTVEPSILCLGCQHHGFVRDGRWVSA